MAQALLTSVALGLLGLVGTAIVGWLGADLSRHISFGIFSTMMTLLAHSMMMFYLIGKGKAVKEAMLEGQLHGDHYRRIAAARKPVFSTATAAMTATIIAALLGASVDTGVLPPLVHSVIALVALVGNVAAIKVEIAALSVSRQVVDQVNHLLQS